MQVRKVIHNGVLAGTVIGGLGAAVSGIVFYSRENENITKKPSNDLKEAQRVVFYLGGCEEIQVSKECETALFNLANAQNKLIQTEQQKKEADKNNGIAMGASGGLLLLSASIGLINACFGNSKPKQLEKSVRDDI